MNLTPHAILLLILPLLAHASELPPLRFAARGSEASTEQICHGDTCYPRVFVPTHEFAVIKSDQEIPTGLHIRMNVATGEREAKINVPSEADAEHEAVIVVPSAEEEEAIIAELPQGAPREQPLGKQNIKPPKDSTTDSGVFGESVATLLPPAAGAAELTKALEELSEIAHEAYWGAQLTSHTGVVPALLGLLENNSPHRAMAALVLGSAVSNNPKALSSAAVHPLAHTVLTALEGESEENVMKRLLFLLGQILRDSSVRADFLSERGVGVVVHVFTRAGPAVMGRIATVIEDAFLNADMRVDGEAVKETERLQELMPLCAVFQEGLAGTKDAEVDEREKILSALKALTATVGCAEGRKTEL
ncbi:hypothetical protein BZA05DRAFT_407054 [Tricharina praecox]|uniref:uncharacterized protein n=1 Tax=Tricharina praecox TaxID=43433 RepID=UPI00221F2339|nr:uncharacterized protein BZA05DRAFT_407054 [Tricharina praecox]KAI5846140.1 hypothetical protein BZA05DRAFT_407054 [Tricharina praecox]